MELRSLVNALLPPLQPDYLYVYLGVLARILLGVDLANSRRRHPGSDPGGQTGSKTLDPAEARGSPVSIRVSAIT